MLDSRLRSKYRWRSSTASVQPGSRAARAYGQEIVFERHRHRFEFNNEYRAQLAEFGLEFSGTSPDERLVEIAELADHPWMVGTQFHPEFKSRPNRPHPLFRDFIGACKERAERPGRQLGGQSTPRPEQQVGADR